MTKSLTDGTSVDDDANVSDPDVSTDASDGPDEAGEQVSSRRGVVRTWVGEHPRAALAGAVAFALLLALVTAYLAREPQVPDGTVAVVGEQEISTKQLDRRVEALKALYGLEEPSGTKAQDGFRRDAAKSAVVALLIEQAAEDRGIEVTDKEVDTILAKLIRERYPDGGQAAFVEALGVMGANESQVRDELRQQAIVAALFDDVTAGVEVTDDQVRTAYDDRRAELATPERRQLLNIVVETRAEADTVLGLLRRGRPFAQVAGTYSIDSATRSEGGLLGTASRKDLEGAYGDAAFGAEAGALFGPVKTETGWHVGQVRKIVAATPVTFAEVEASLRSTLETEDALARWRSFLEDLLTDADVRYHADYLPEDPASLPADVEENTP